MVGAVMLYSWQLGSPWPAWYRIASVSYWTGMLPFLMLAAEQFWMSSKRPVVVGLSLTLPMYLSFTSLWLIDEGSPNILLVTMPFSGVLLGPSADWLARRSKPRVVEYPPLCSSCGYSLRGLRSNRCPECGQEDRNGDRAKQPEKEDANG